MSVYSGFSTRVQEAQYYRLVESLISLLQTRVLFSMKTSPRPEDTNWLQRFNTIYSNMKNMEFHKYLEPKLSDSCKGLARYFSIGIDNDFDIQDYQFSHRKQEKPKKKKLEVRRLKEKSENLGDARMSKYYGRIMDNFLAQPKSLSPMKKSGVSISLDSQDFWLLDDKIAVIDKDGF